jgi:hypothetical protein
VLIAKEETVLQVFTDRFISIGKYYGMKMDVAKLRQGETPGNNPQYTLW